MSISTVWLNPQILSAQGDATFQKTIRPFLENHCIDCHSEGGEGDVDLDRFTTSKSIKQDLAFWGHITEVLERGEMPPADCDQPELSELRKVREWILGLIVDSGPPARPLGALRRLNRVEYENTIRDLFLLSRDCFSNPARIIQSNDYFDPASGEMPQSVLAISYLAASQRRHSDLPGVSNLPIDPPAPHGFANEQSALSLSPLLVEQYFELASQLLDNKEFHLISGLWRPMFTEGDAKTKSEQSTKAHTQIGDFLPRAFRRAVTEFELEKYRQLFDSEFGAGESYTTAMKTTVAAILVSPHFLLRQEFSSRPKVNDQEEQIWKNYAMASRLSYFLWGSMPDDELFKAAKENRLTSSEELLSQTERMMRDRKVKSLATDFGMQWLKVSKVASVAPDQTLYPKFYDETMPLPNISMMIEQLLFFETIMIENRSIMDFVSADFSYLNRQLLLWYQEDPKKAAKFIGPLADYEDFYRIKWTNQHRGGVIASGATLISTSTTTRTSPVFRGAWILDVVFNSPPPPAPANVKPLVPSDGDTEHVRLNVRNRLERHRLDPTCATCHNRIDPLGFALEKFDATGKWRPKYETGDAIDSSGEFARKGFDGAFAFKASVKRQESRFVKAFCEHTMKYALGRQLHYSDKPEIERVAAGVKADELRFRSVIKRVVSSELFRRFEQLPQDSVTAESVDLSSEKK